MQKLSYEDLESGMIVREVSHDTNMLIVAKNQEDSIDNGIPFIQYVDIDQPINGTQFLSSLKYNRYFHIEYGREQYSDILYKCHEAFERIIADLKHADAILHEHYKAA